MPRRALALAVAGLVALAAGDVAAQEPSTATPPAPTRWVTDHAGFLSEGTRAALDAKLAAYEQRTGHQLVVWIDRSLGGRPLDDFATRTFAAWGLGRKGHDDGLALFIFADDRKIAIEVGYGLEAVVPDARAARIISETLAPLLREGQNDRAVAAAVNELLGLIEGRPAAELGLPETPETRAPPPQAPGGGEGPSPFELILFVVLGVIVLAVLIRNPALAAILLSNMFRGGGGGGMGGGWGGGFSGGGGGFSGGGGRSGGGGARGGW
jgi:uncharacterized protein